MRFDVSPECDIEGLHGPQHVLAVSSDDGLVENDGWLGHIADVLTDVSIP